MVHYCASVGVELSATFRYAALMTYAICYIRDIVVRVLLILGVALLAFAHQPLRANVVDLSAYAMPDGTLPELCIVAVGADQPAHQIHCPACHLAAEIPAPSPIVAAIWTQLPETLPPQTTAQIIPSLRATAPPEARAPPTLTV